jgi:hypothetical protein
MQKGKVVEWQATEKWQEDKQVARRHANRK